MDMDGYGGFHEWGYPIAGRFTKKNPWDIPWENPSTNR